MHDWTLIDITVDWENGMLKASFRDSKSRIQALSAEGLVELVLPRHQPWGRSVSVNGFTVEQNGTHTKARLEMQSGDEIEIIASLIRIPATDA